MITFQGYPQDGGLYTEYNVLQDNQVIGFIAVCGIFRKNSDGVSLTEEDKETIRMMCRLVHNMPANLLRQTVHLSLWCKVMTIVAEMFDILSCQEKRSELEIDDSIQQDREARQRANDAEERNRRRDSSCYSD